MMGDGATQTIGSMLTDSELQHGYWGARRLAGQLPDIAHHEPEDFAGGDALFLSKDPSQNQTPAREKKRLERWCQAIPKMKIKTIVFGITATQSLLDAAAQVEGLEAVWAPTTTVDSLEPLAACSSLRALELGSRSVIGDLAALSRLPELRHLRLLHMKDRHDLEFVRGLGGLREFGFLWKSIDRVPTVDSLEPLAALSHLQVLWLDVKVARCGLRPLHGLRELANVQVSFHHAIDEFEALRDKLPQLRFGTPLDEASVRRFGKRPS
jgi:hypothetical protein